MAKINTLEDNVLIELLRFKKDKAVELIYRIYWKELYSYIFSISRNRSMTEDIVQETFFNLWKYRDQLNIDKTIIGYLKITSRNIFIKWANKQNMDTSLYLDPTSEIANWSSNENSYENNDSFNHLKSQIQYVVELMPPQMKDVFLLRKEMELSYKHISEKMNIKESTVKKQLYYAMKLIKEYIK